MDIKEPSDIPNPKKKKKKIKDKNRNKPKARIREATDLTGAERVLSGCEHAGAQQKKKHGKVLKLDERKEMNHLLYKKNGNRIITYSLK